MGENSNCFPQNISTHPNTWSSITSFPILLPKFRPFTSVLSTPFFLNTSMSKNNHDFFESIDISSWLNFISQSSNNLILLKARKSNKKKSVRIEMRKSKEFIFISSLRIYFFNFCLLK